MIRHRKIYIPDHPYAMAGGTVLESRLIAEKALGKFLNPKHPVHHHTDTQLVICENNGYHRIIHQRTRAYEACGHANWLKCKFCKQYDDPKNLRNNSAGIYHNSCHYDYNLKWQERR